jgi:K+ transporter
VLGAVVFGGVELIFLSANLAKIVEGGWLPLLVAALVVTVMTDLAARSEDHHRAAGRRGGAVAEFVDRLDAATSPGCRARRCSRTPRSSRRRSRCGRTSSSTTCCTSGSSSCR